MNPSAPQGVPATAGTPRDRDVVLDLTKGVLVVFMVIYHSLNYSSQYRLPFQLMAFLPPSFVVITGFLLARVYQPRYRRGDTAANRRLVTRGARLLVLFLVLNIAGTAVRCGGEVSLWFQGWLDLAREWRGILVTGNSRVVAFEILLPIAYLLMLAPLLLRIDRMAPLVMPVVAAVTVATLEILDQEGHSWANAQLVAAGLVGVLAGRLPPAFFDGLRRFWWAAALMYALVYGFAALCRRDFAVQSMEACTALMAIYGGASWFAGSGFGSERLRVLGQHSLVAYVVQIGVLQVIGRVVGRPDPDSMMFAALFLATLAATIATAEFLAWARPRSPAIDTMYRAVFA